MFETKEGKESLLPASKYYNSIFEKYGFKIVSERVGTKRENNKKINIFSSFYRLSNNIRHIIQNILRTKNNLYDSKSLLKKFLTTDENFFVYNSDIYTIEEIFDIDMPLKCIFY